MTAISGSAGRMRRYPALGFLIVAAILATLLPSSLRVPLSGPSVTAEIAPVPGHSDMSNGDISSLDATSTNGLGSGLGSGGNGGGGGTPPNPPPPPPPPNTGGNPVQKKCVGKSGSTRQTEDPLSPSCVAFFKGDNFGATWDGVSRDEVKVIVYGGCNEDGTFSLVDVNTQAWSGWHWPEYLHYFNDRFQTYGRTVRAYVTTNGKGEKAGKCTDNGPVTKTVVQNLHDQAHPFYITGFYDDFTSQALSEEASRLHIMSQILSPTRAFSNANAPYVVSFDPDIENASQSVSGIVCNVLAGRPGSYGEPSDRAKTRKFGLVYARVSDSSNVGADQIRKGVADRCGDKAGDIEIGAVGRAPTADDMARLRALGVTTVLWIRSGVPAEAGNWRPEYVMLDDEFMGRNDVARAYGGVLSSAMGLMMDRRRGSFNEQPEKVALRQVCPDCLPNSIDIGIYNKLLLLFTGIQAAGPKLTPVNFDKGLRALPAHSTGDPFVPTAYFGPGDHSFIKDYALTWWDSTGDPPGENAAPGCWRLMQEGKRFQAGDWNDWQRGDAEIQQHVPEQVCQGEQ
ncbi:MAG: hypothetical protein QOK43_305 [Acidimicrobiaceae bacterium]|jgi:hypothetical protein|nr:hypothetical protein [Acidimicrobiaceae bacterium]MDQ1443650.1 hypothetical protein [Acidimicrobiaceae bacterium]